MLGGRKSIFCAHPMVECRQEHTLSLRVQLISFLSPIITLLPRQQTVPPPSGGREICSIPYMGNQSFHACLILASLTKQRNIAHRSRSISTYIRPPIYIYIYIPTRTPFFRGRRPNPRRVHSVLFFSSLEIISAHSVHSCRAYQIKGKHRVIS